MIQHVYRRVVDSGLLQEVIVATDDQRILDTVTGFGGRAVMTSPDCQTGTDRVAEAARGIKADVIINVQGDEPLIPLEVIQAVLEPFTSGKDPLMATAATRFASYEQFLNPNQGKVVVNKHMKALYFSRAPIPYDMNKAKDEPGKIPDCALKTIGIYGFRPDFLATFAELEPTPLEKTERLEQIRALEHGYDIWVGFTEKDTQGVDTPEDLHRVRNLMLKEGE